MAKFEAPGPRNDSKKFNKFKDSEPSRSPRANRTSPEFQKSYKDRKESRPEGFPSGEKRSSSFEQGRTDRPGGRAKREAPPDNVSLNLSPRLMELAQELAEQSKMNIKAYLTEALRYVLLAHGKRLGKSDKFVNEFVSTNSSPVNTWRPVSEQLEQYEPEQIEADRSDSDHFLQQRMRARADSRADTGYSQRHDRIGSTSTQGNRQNRFDGDRKQYSQGNRITRSTARSNSNSSEEASRRSYSGSQGSRSSVSRTDDGAGSKSYGAKKYGAQSSNRFDTRSTVGRGASRPEADGDTRQPRTRRTESGANGNSFASSRSRTGSTVSPSRPAGKNRSSYSGSQTGYSGYNQASGSRSRSSGSYGAARSTVADRSRSSNNSQAPRRPRTGGGGAKPVNRSR